MLRTFTTESSTIIPGASDVPRITSYATMVCVANWTQWVPEIWDAFQGGFRPIFQASAGFAAGRGRLA